MDELARLRWQCRRGTRELDFLLNRYLDTEYLVVDRRERALFVELLKLEDDELMAVLMGKMEMDGMKFLIEKIKGFSVARV